MHLTFYIALQFLKRVGRSEGFRAGRRQDEDDGDDGDEGGIQGVINSVAEGDGLGALSGLPAIVPSFINTLTQISGAVNQGLNGTDTPNIPSFLVRQGLEAIKLFQAVSGAANSNRNPSSESYTPQRIPGGPPMRKPRPPVNYEPYPSGSDPDDYLDEDVKQPLQPTLRPLRPGGASGPQSLYEPQQGGNSPQSPYEPMYGFNPSFQTPDHRRPVATTPVPSANINGYPSGTSLWQIYKSFSTKTGGHNGSLTNFQLAHPEAFSNELLQSIAQSISNVRNPNQVAPTDKPSSEIFKQFYPSTSPSLQAAAFFNNPNRPTLSVYKPGGAPSAVGIDLNSIALNVSLLNKVEQQASNEEVGEEPTVSPSLQQELEVANSASVGVGSNKLEGSGRPTSRPFMYKSPVLVSTGSFSKLQAQQEQALSLNKGPTAQFVKSPTSSHLTISHNGQYVPAITSLHEGDDYAHVVGPQANAEDSMNGFVNKAPYTPDKLGIIMHAPRITPSPLFFFKPPSNLVINKDAELEETTQAPKLTFLNSNARPGSSGAFSLYPTKVNSRPVDPNALRPSAVIASIPSKLQLNKNPLYSIGGQSTKNPLHTTGVLPPSLIPQKPDNIPDNIVTQTSFVTETSVVTEINIVTGTDIVSSSTKHGEDVQYEVEAEVETVTTDSQTDDNDPVTDSTKYPEIINEANDPNAYPDAMFISTISSFIAEAHEENNGLGEISTLPEDATEEEATTVASTSSEQSNENYIKRRPSLASILSNSLNQFRPQPASIISNVAIHVEPDVTPSLTSNIKQVEPQIPPSFINKANPFQIPASLDTDHQLKPHIASNFVNSRPQISANIPQNSHNKVTQALLSSFNFPNFIRPESQEISESETSESVTDSSTLEPEISEVPLQMQEDIVSSTVSNFMLDETTVPPSNTLELVKFASFPFHEAQLTHHKTSPPPPPRAGVGDSTFSASLLGGNRLHTSVISQFPNFSQSLALNRFPSFGNSGTEPSNNIESTSVSNTVNGSEESSVFTGISQPPGFPSFVQDNKVLPSVISQLKVPMHSEVHTWPGVPQQMINQEALGGSEVSPFPILNNSSSTQSPPPDFIKFSFSNPHDYFPDQNNNFQGAQGSALPIAQHEPFSTNDNAIQTTFPPTSESTSGGLPTVSPQNIQNFNYFPGSGQVVSSSVYSPDSQENQNQPVPAIISGSQFQGPVQNTGYPAFVPSAPFQVGSPASQYHESTILTSSTASTTRGPYSSGDLLTFAQNSPNSPNFGIPFAQANSNQIFPEEDSTPQPQFGSFGQKLTSHNFGASAIAEMSKLPYYQLDSFRPSALPPMLASVGNKEEDDYELSEIYTAKPVSELFSTASNVSVGNSTSTQAPPYSTERIVVEEDSEEQAIPNFIPGKPAFWMNMYYPGGVPVLTKVKTTKAPTMKPRRRRKRSTTFAPRTTPITGMTEPEYYEDDDVGLQKKRKKKVNVDIVDFA